MRIVDRDKEFLQFLVSRKPYICDIQIRTYDDNQCWWTIEISFPPKSNKIFRLYINRELVNISDTLQMIGAIDKGYATGEWADAASKIVPWFLRGHEMPVQVSGTPRGLHNIAFEDYYVWLN